MAVIKAFYNSKAVIFFPVCTAHYLYLASHFYFWNFFFEKPFQNSIPFKKSWSITGKLFEILFLSLPFPISLYETLFPHTCFSTFLKASIHFNKTEDVKWCCAEKELYSITFLSSVYVFFGSFSFQQYFFPSIFQVFYLLQQVGGETLLEIRGVCAVIPFLFPFPCPLSPVIPLPIFHLPRRPFKASHLIL